MHSEIVNSRGAVERFFVIWISMKTPGGIPGLLQRNSASSDDRACAADATVCVGSVPPSLSAQNHTARRPRPYFEPPVYLVTVAALTW